MNATYIRELGANDLAGRLLQVLLKQGFPAEFRQVRQFVPLIQERLKTLSEAPEWVDFFYADELTYPTDELIQKKMDREGALATIANLRSGLAEMESFETIAIEARLRELNEASGLKARDFFGCLRVAVSGKRVAPPLFESLEILGQPETLKRLDEAMRRLSDS